MIYEICRRENFSLCLHCTIPHLYVRVYVIDINFMTAYELLSYLFNFFLRITLTFFTTTRGTYIHTHMYQNEIHSMHLQYCTMKSTCETEQICLYIYISLWKPLPWQQQFNPAW